MWPCVAPLGHDLESLGLLTGKVHQPGDNLVVWNSTTTRLMTTRMRMRMLVMMGESGDDWSFLTSDVEVGSQQSRL